MRSINRLKAYCVFSAALIIAAVFLRLHGIRHCLARAISRSNSRT